MPGTWHTSRSRRSYVEDSHTYGPRPSLRYGRSLSTSNLLPVSHVTSDVTRNLAPTSYETRMRFGAGSAGSRGRMTSFVTSLDDDPSPVDSMKARRLHSALEQLRRYGVGRADRDVEDRRVLLGDLHSFTNTLNGLELPSVSAPSTSHRRDLDQPTLTYADRMAETRSDLKHLEQLIGQTFRWGEASQPSVSGMVESSSPINGLIWESRQPTDSYVVRDPTVTDYTQSTSLAALAVRWAEERRQAVERELGANRHRDNVDFVSRSYGSGQFLDAGSGGGKLNEYEMLNRVLQPISATTTRHYLNVDSEPVTSHYVRSSSVSPGLHSLPSDWSTTNAMKPQMSDARRKVRDVLCKAKGDPHYFSNRQMDY